MNWIFQILKNILLTNILNDFINKFKYKLIEEKANNEEENKELEAFKNKELLNKCYKKNSIFEDI